MNIEILQNDSSISLQRTIVAQVLPELEAFIIIGRRTEYSERPRNFVSCTFSGEELANAVANFILAHPQTIKPFVFGVSTAFECLRKNEES